MGSAALRVAASRALTAEEMREQHVSFIKSTIRGDEVSRDQIRFELKNSDVHPCPELKTAIAGYDFLRLLVPFSLARGRPLLSHAHIKALNYKTLAHERAEVVAGVYRQCPAWVGEYRAPAHTQIPALMDGFINHVNSVWDTTDEIRLATYILWGICHIHPFMNGNGRTARAASYFALCVKAGGWLQGSVILPELLKKNKAEYTAAIEAANRSVAHGRLDLSILHALMSRLLEEQLRSCPC